ncbi:alpha/beta hydrolase [Paraburkholderia strydomiana]|uniref:alpha/beta hydrolase n=1 Tax=Paraburkholderia strydomiana TaxID=1245417 RepID=UPI00285C296A|nr:alpha/beta fold hydrolase [Paraburkholderia strydomiana]MDR7009388.1 pimeloyl-ACP methyl ester carboxylesterase [Paraburkholderia strydomiana]
MSQNIVVTGKQLVFEELRVATGTPGIDLYVRNKRPAPLETFTAERTIVMVHGATFSSGSLYDVPFNGMSFIDFLAAAGYDVYALDVRGYGHSTRPAEMEQAADLSPPVVGTDIGLADLGTVVDYVLKRRQLDKVSVFGMSWCGTVAGAYNSRNNDKVHKLVLLAPQWLSDRPIPIDTGGRPDAWRLVPVRESKARWLSTAPDTDARAWSRNVGSSSGPISRWPRIPGAESARRTSCGPVTARSRISVTTGVRDENTTSRPRFVCPCCLSMASGISMCLLTSRSRFSSNSGTRLTVSGLK